VQEVLEKLRKRECFSLLKKKFISKMEKRKTEGSSTQRRDSPQAFNLKRARGS